MGFLMQGCTNPVHQVAMATKMFIVPPNIVCILSMKPPFCHPSGALNFEVAFRFDEVCSLLVS
jgi:hypothetical protein